MTTAIPYHVEINRIIELLAAQIYQSPLALLRENCQNAFDAVLERIWWDPDFVSPEIRVEIAPGRIQVSDNGIGMSPADLESHYWRAGSSGKNNPESRAAGVVGTFGIGAMANFGVASELIITTESWKTGERTISRVEREMLSASEPCISIQESPPEGKPGTSVEIVIEEGIQINLTQAAGYISEAVKYVPVHVTVNGTLVSRNDLGEALPRPGNAGGVIYKNAQITGQIEASVELAIGFNGEPWVRVTNLRDGSDPINGEVILAQDRHQIYAYRTGFALAASAVQSHFGLGGVANLSSLTPTAGREALTSPSVQFLQNLVAGLERLIAEYIGTLAVSDNSTRFMEWARQNNRFDLCHHIGVMLEPEGRFKSLITLNRSTDARTWNIYSGREQTIVDGFATDEQPLVVLSATQPRRGCQEGYLRNFSNVASVPDRPTVIDTKPESKWSLGESALAFRLGATLESDYFVPCIVQYARISHGLPLIVETSQKPVLITLDSNSSTIAPMLQLYETDYEALTGFVKDFIRNAIFPKVSSLVPSSTRDGAAAFLKSIRRPPDLFEYEHTDLGSLNEIWHEYALGSISMVEAARRSASISRSTVQVLEPANASTVEEVLSDVVANDKLLASVELEDELTALPAITRPEVESDAKLLLVPAEEEPLRGYRGFLALTDRVRREHTDFFLQPHRTEIVWGGQKAMYIFQHHSGEFSLYYDLQGNELLPGGPSGCRIPTSTMIVKNQVYIPIPDVILEGFWIGPGQRKSFEVRCDLLFPEPP